MTYDAYSQFIVAARKFPRWTNTRRRPVESNGGKILRSIIEEIAAVEDAIIAYKKDFFIVNYKGREEEIIDYLYTAHVGDIQNLDLFTAIDPAFSVTDDIELFYQDHSYAYYKNGYLVFYETNEENRLTYTYNVGGPYYAEITENHIWNVIDEFAWWCGLERFNKERNASLLQRCLYQLHYSKEDPALNYRPNSTEKGLKNALRNAASAYGNLSEEEIQFLEPNEETLAIKNQDGITLYEEIARFNRDIARTRQWDIDYWDNQFRQLHYLPHIWDADVKLYKNGVGYQNSLLVGTAKELGIDNTINLEITGYEPDQASIEQYMIKHPVETTIPLTLTKYTNEIKAFSVPYQIKAESAMQITDPDQIFFDFYKDYVGTHTHYIDDLFVSCDTEIQAEIDNKIESGQEYTLSFSLSGEEKGRLEIDSCQLLSDNQEPEDLLALFASKNSSSPFQRQNGRLVNTKVWLHATTVSDIANPKNLKANQNGGIILTNPLEQASFEIPLSTFLNNKRNTPFEMPVSGGFQTITFLPSRVHVMGYEVTQDGTGYQSPSTASKENEKFVITSDHCSFLTFHATGSADSLAAIQVKVDGKISSLSIPQHSMEDFYCSLDFNDGKSDTAMTTHQIEVEIIRTSGSGFVISNIQSAEYDINTTLVVYDNKNNLVYQEPVVSNTRQGIGIPDSIQNQAANARLICIIKNYTAVSPVIEFIHIGNLSNPICNIPCNTENKINPRLKIQTNSHIKLLDSTGHIIDTDFTTHTKYTNTSDSPHAIYLDLSMFTKIYRSVPEQKQAVQKGETVSYILVDPGDSIRTISIYGEGSAAIGRKTLRELLDVDFGTNVILSRIAQGCIIQKNEPEITLLSYDKLHFGNRIKISSNAYPTIQGCFVTNQNKNTYELTNDFSGTFDLFYLYPYDIKEYISYNQENVFRAVTVLPMKNAFYPIPDPNVRLIYWINDNGSHASIFFTKENTGIERKWSIDDTEQILIKVATYEGTIDSNLIQSVTSVLYPKLMLSNTIRLDNITDDLGNLIDLAEYNISPPNTMEVVFKPVEQPEHQTEYPDHGTIRIEDDGFTKLKHTHITKVIQIKLANGISVSDTAYTLWKTEGIIAWNSAQYFGEAISEIIYTYQKPVALCYKNIADLYDVTGYQFDTMRRVNRTDYIIENVKDGDIIPLKKDYFKDDIIPSVVSIICKDGNEQINPYYAAFLQDQSVVVQRVADDNTPMIHNGYYYIDGREYYYFANKKEQDQKKVDGVDIENGQIVNNVLVLQQEAINYLKNSRMECNKLDIHCIVDFMYPRNQTNQEPLQRISACESFAAWYDYGMQHNIVVYRNGYATQLTGTEQSFALLNITKALTGHTTISCLYTGSLRFSLGREIRILNEQALKTVFCKKIQSFIKSKDIAYCIPDMLDTAQYRYYLIVEGSGILDEVLIHDAKEKKDIEAWHVKGIDVLGLLTEETETQEKTIDIDYIPDFISYNNLETDKEGVLRPSTTIDWNISRLYEFDLNTVSKQNFLYRNQLLVAQKDGALIETKPYELSYRKSIQRLALKVNMLPEKQYKGFTIRVYASGTYDGTYTKIAEKENENLLTFTIVPANRFIKFQVVAKENRLIQQLVLLASYKESEDETLPVLYHTSGSAVTKLFDIGAIGTYRFKEVLYEEGSTWGEIWVRALRRGTTGETDWTTWKNTEKFPDFENCQLFQFKIIMNRQSQQAKIKGFRFEVLSHV